MNTDQPEPVVGSAPVPGADSIAVADTAAQLEALACERDQLARENADLRERLLRRQADFENFRRRSEKERLELVEFAGMNAAGALLPILDDFERALKVECADKEYARGIELIYQRLGAALAASGLEPLQAEGQPFDPNLHHAVEMVRSSDHQDHTVIQELQRGYLFRGRLLRPAMVKVAVQP
jgi:molecular chaperone GrpE